MNFESRNFLLPENKFFFLNLENNSLSFVLDWDTNDKFYYNLLNQQFFANVLDKPNEHSMVLAKPDDCTYFHNTIPAFDIKYIEHCFDLKQFPDPTKYLITKSCPVTYIKQDIVDCWFHQKKSWSDLIPVPNNDENGSEISSINSFHQKNNYVFDSDSNDSLDSNRKQLHRTASTALLKKNLNRDNIPDSNQDYPAKLRNNSDDEHNLNSNQLSRFMPSSSTSILPNKKSRLPYTHKEDTEIVKYIVKNKYAFNITGKQMWQNMERANICKIRTWQSMKERYIKHIKYDLTTGNSKFPFLSQNDLKLLRQGLHIDVIKKTDKEKLRSKFQDERIDEWLSE